MPARSQSVAVGTDDLVDPTGAGEAYYYDPDEQVEPEPKALRWARENPWCAGSCFAELSSLVTCNVVACQARPKLQAVHCAWEVAWCAAYCWGMR